MVSRRRMLQVGAALAGSGVLAGCGQLPFQSRPAARMPRIGNLSAGPPGPTAPAGEAWLTGLREHGWIDGQNVTIEYRFGDSKVERYPDLAAELVALQPDVIFTGAGVPAIRALQSATSTIPIVMVSSTDVVEEGTVASFASPGGNVTGVSLSSQISAKRLELLKETLPTISRVTMLWYTGQQGQASAADGAAKALGIELRAIEARDRDELERALDTAASWPAEALLISSGPLFSQQQALMVQGTAAKRLPTMYYTSEFTTAGGLMAYGPNTPEMFRQAASQVDKILRGAQPSALPVEQPARIDFVVNLQTAEALGLTIPPAVLLQATDVIH